ncbi:MAG: hypothetical protein Q8M31_16600 [Beijerinckiaceae bacterium]|nr:hypothetical protein [Beijerinckiaceae bacterium]
MSAQGAGRVIGIILRAFGMGLGALIVIPLTLAYGLLALSHLAGGCGAGSSGGCEMGAAAVGLYAMPFAFVIGAAFSVIRDVRKPRP